MSDIVARIDALIPADEVNSHPLVWRARNIDLALLIDARNEIRALRAEVKRLLIQIELDADIEALAGCMAQIERAAAGAVYSQEMIHAMARDALKSLKEAKP